MEDLPLLVQTFVKEFATRMGKNVTKVPRKAMEELQNHAWPGNIRELRNIIERGVILSVGERFRLPPLMKDTTPLTAKSPVSLADMEREHIVKTLHKTGWRIKGPQGAAHLLDLKPGTLYSRMKKLNIPFMRQMDGKWPTQQGAEGESEGA
jgi:transcriptional regulator with GAF, ATPase, and Fis domain